MKNYDLIKQKFLIELYPKTRKDTLTIKLKSNADLTHLKASVHFMEDFKYYANLKLDILQSIYKAMIGLFDFKIG